MFNWEMRTFLCDRGVYVNHSTYKNIYYTSVEKSLFTIVYIKVGKIKLSIDTGASVCVLKCNKVIQTIKINLYHKYKMRDVWHSKNKKYISKWVFHKLNLVFTSFSFAFYGILGAAFLIQY